MDNSFLDKIINQELIKKDGTMDKIACPATGQKPDISLKGKMIQSGLITRLELRITNFYPSVPLRDYATINIDAGYSNSVVRATMSGQVWTAFQESPGPDGVTFFEINLGVYDKWLNGVYSKNFDAGSPVTNLYQWVADILGLDFSGSGITDTLTDSIFLGPKNVNGLIADITTLTGIKYITRMDSKALVVFPHDSNTGKVFNIDYFSASPQRSAAGWIFNSPWYPDLRVGDLCKIDPKYFKTTFAVQHSDIFTPDLETGVNDPAPSSLTVLTIDFEFRTNGPQNLMSVVALDGTEQAKEDSQ